MRSDDLVGHVFQWKMHLILLGRVERKCCFSCVEKIHFGHLQGSQTAEDILPWLERCHDEALMLQHVKSPDFLLTLAKLRWSPASLKAATYH